MADGGRGRGGRGRGPPYGGPSGEQGGMGQGRYGAGGSEYNPGMGYGPNPAGFSQGGGAGGGQGGFVPGTGGYPGGFAAPQGYGPGGQGFMPAGQPGYAYYTMPQPYGAAFPGGGGYATAAPPFASGSFVGGPPVFPAGAFAVGPPGVFQPAPGPAYPGPTAGGQGAYSAGVYSPAYPPQGSSFAQPAYPAVQPGPYASLPSTPSYTPGGPGRGSFSGAGPSGSGGPGRGPGRGAPGRKDMKGGRGGGGKGGADFREVELDEGVARLTAALEGIQITGPKQEEGSRAKRPNYGSAGRVLKVFVNHFLVDIGIDQAYHYDIAVVPLRTPKEGEGPGSVPEEPLSSRTASLGKRFNAEVVTECATAHEWPVGWVYDNKKNLYSPRQFLPMAESTFNVELKVDEGKRKPRQFKVITKWVATHNITALLDYCKVGGTEVPRDALQALDIALRHGASLKPNCVPVGRGLYFYDQATLRSLGGGCEAWLGYQQALKPCQFGLTLNVDAAATGFVASRNLADFMAEVAGARGPMELNKNGISESQLRRIGKALRNLKIKTNHRGTTIRRYKVEGLNPMAANVETFPHEKFGREITISEYFEETYPGLLKYPTLPCIRVKVKNGFQSLPPEVCTVEPGQRRLKLDEAQTAEMIKIAAQRPSERRTYIESVINTHAQLNSDPTVLAFGMRISNTMLQIEARVLPQPMLAYTRPQCMDVGTAGHWNLKDAKFARAVELDSFAVVCLAPEHEVTMRGVSGIWAFLNDLLQMLDETGVVVNAKDPPILFKTQGMNVYQHLMEAATAAYQQYNKKAQLLLVLLQTKAADLYKEVKRVTDSALGIPSQCFVMKPAGIGFNNAPKGRPQYCANLCMKINAKLGGTNVKLAGEPSQAVPVIGHKPFMLLGADVTHPTTRSDSEPSVAAVVGSLDKFVGRYASRTCIQPSRKETILNLKEMVRELLLEFYRYNNQRKPEALVFYRDGVSEGMFAEVLREEYTAIRDACREMADPDYTPPITFIIVQKRHNTRLFPPDETNADRSGNVLPGTVVDVAITHPTEFDFFLNSHAGIQGTSKPAHYHVLVDENGFGGDGIQLLTYWLCYLYCRCTRSVSYVPPAYYAHLAAFRGKIMVQHSDSASEVSGYSAGPSYAAIHRDLSRTMYYV